MPEHRAQEVFRFGEFVLDVGRGSFTRNGARVKLRPKSLHMLKFLVENQGRVVSKQELMDAIWPDTAVTEDSLTQCLIDIRKVLGDKGREIVQTVPRRGYIFEAPRPQGDLSGPGEVQSEVRRTRRLWAIGALAASLATGWVWIASNPAGTPNGEAKTVLVMPFEAIPPGADDAWMSLGLTERLITRLSGLRGVVVRPLSAVLRYVDQPIDPLDAGRKQRVDYVLVGGIRKTTDEIRTSVGLWSVREGDVVWTKVFGEPDGAVLELEDVVSSRIAEAFELHLTTEEKRRLTKRATANPEAMAHYYRGLHLREQGTRSALEQAVKYLRTAIEIDPSFANAYVALASAFGDLSSPLQNREESTRQIKILLQRALALEGDLADAHALLAVIRWRDGDFAGAETALSTALRLNPNSISVVSAHQRYALVLGDYDRAIAFAQRLCDLDPLSSRACESVPTAHLAARDYDQAIEGYQRILATDPAFAPARTGLGIAYIGKQQYPRGIAILENVLETERAPERIRFCLLAFAYARSGRTAEARAMLAEMERERERRSIPAQFFAVIYAGLGENDLAFEALDRAYEDRSGPPLVRISQPSIDIALEVLHDDPRYADFAHRKGFAAR